MTTEEKLVKVAENRAKLVEKGKKTEWNALWDGIQQNGKRRNYECAFACIWDDNTFKPKYDMMCNEKVSHIFRNSQITDLTKILEDCNVTLDVSEATNADYAFCSHSHTRLPALSWLTTNTLMCTYGYCRELVTIGKITLKDDGTQALSSTFYGLYALENVEIGGVIGQNVDFRHSTKLTHDSLMSIINALKDYSTDTSGTVYRITLGGDNISKLTTDELKMIEDKGWQYA